MGDLIEAMSQTQCDCEVINVDICLACLATKCVVKKKSRQTHKTNCPREQTAKKRGSVKIPSLLINLHALFWFPRRTPATTETEKNKTNENWVGTNNAPGQDAVLVNLVRE